MAFAEDFPEEPTDEGTEDNADTVKSGDNPSEKKSDSETADKPEKKNSTVLIGVLAVAGIGGAVYFKVIKPKQGNRQNKNQVYDDEEEYEDEPVNEDTPNDSDNEQEEE